jgi:transcription initiation protein SPT3
MKIKLPWELSTLYSEFVGGIGDEENDEEDEDDIEAHEDSLQRLRDADEATRLMTKDEYVHYSECRQASFTFRKSKKFREFINAGAYLDVKPNDDIIDVLGFLAFEVVRELCVGAIALKNSFEEEEAQLKRLANGSRKRREIIENGNGNGQLNAEEIGNEDGVDDVNGKGTGSSSSKRKDAPIGSAQSSPNKRNKNGTAAGPDAETQKDSGDSSCGLFTMPPAKSSPLMTSHVREAFARLQRNRAVLSAGGGGQPGGLRRTRVFVI